MGYEKQLTDRRKRIKTKVRQTLGTTLLAVCTLIAIANFFGSPTAFPSSVRTLAESSSSSADTESDECADLQDWERNGGIVVYIISLCYLFVALAIICDEYFVSSLEKITEKMGLSQDVAGATFMAAGSSAPELFVSLADNVFHKPEESMGIGTIVGSAIFNILIIIALSGLLSKETLDLDWRPFLRDSIWYIVSILMLTYATHDGEVDVYEALVMFSTYFCYIAYMSINAWIVDRLCKRPGDDDEEEQKEDVEKEKDNQMLNVDPSSSSAIELAKSDATSSPKTEMTRSSHASHHSEVSTTEGDEHHHQTRMLGHHSKLNPMYQSKYRAFQSHLTHQHPGAHSDLEDGGANHLHIEKHTTDESSPQVLVVTDSGSNVQEEEELNGYFDEVFHLPETILGKIWWVITFPIVIIARFTIPDCRFPRFSGTCGFTATFFISIIWIAFLSHYTVLWATKFGCIAGIPSALMGLTILAAGTSIPDALSSILVARAGHGDMAVSNAIGSNVFDILLGLGLPFFLSNLVYHEPVAVSVDDLAMSLIILFAVLVLLVVLLMLSRWRLHPVMGGFLATMYGVYVVISYLHGLGQI